MAYSRQTNGHIVHWSIDIGELVSQIDQIPTSPVKQHVQRRFRQYTENREEIPPVFILIESLGDLSSEDLNRLEQFNKWLHNSNTHLT